MAAGELVPSVDYPATAEHLAAFGAALEDLGRAMSDCARLLALLAEIMDDAGEAAGE